MRLLYVGDVPVESSYHGSALLFRLWQDYPPSDLLVIESSFQQSTPERRLTAVRYASLPVGSGRWLRTRFQAIASAVYVARARSWHPQVAKVVGTFAPQAVVTVAHGYSWLAATRFAEVHRLPLHLIVHDDWPRCIPMPDKLRPWVNRRFAAEYRRAASRLCVSSYMEERYRQMYGVEGRVLLPSRARENPAFDRPPERLAHQQRELTALYGGTLSTPGYLDLLRTLARALISCGGKVLVYSPTTRSQAAAEGLNEPNLEWRGLARPDQLIQSAREEADFLFVPMSFAPADLGPMEINFPSKLADYTAIGLPLLIAGPPSTSAMRWAEENPGVAECVSVNETNAMKVAIARLSDPQRRLSLAHEAIRRGQTSFSHSAGQETFFAALNQAHAPS